MIKVYATVRVIESVTSYGCGDEGWVIMMMWEMKREILDMK
jgi:hypothetical protein